MKITEHLRVLVKRDEAASVSKFSNGYMVEVTGRDARDDWASVKIICSSMEEVIAVLEAADAIEVAR